MEQMVPNTGTKMSNTDRVLILEPIDGKLPKSSIGNTDPKLFTGENKLHVIKDEETCHWSLKYEAGSIPESLKQTFTSFKMALKTVENYFANRNIRVKEVIH